MEQYLITIDTGTTNTRVALWNPQGDCVDVQKSGVGVRNTAIDGDNTKLRVAVKQCIDNLLIYHKLDIADVGAVYACGMITSNVGLVEIPHLTAPAGMKDFVAGVQAVMLPDVCALPIHFIPGLKNLDGPVDETNAEAMDIMRGEETEVIALLSWLPADKPLLLVLPGSHTKFITVNEQGQMTGCLTSIAGELLSSLTEHSILADAVGRRYVENDYRKDAMLSGFCIAKKSGFARAAFSTRIMSQFAKSDAIDCANFLLGAVLAEDLVAVANSSALTIPAESDIIVAGKQPLRKAFVDAFVADGRYHTVQEFTPPNDVILSGYGARLVACAGEKAAQV